MSAVLLIGGSDSSGGAGLVRDVRTLSDLDVDPLCALTAVTAQTDSAVLACHMVPVAVLRAQLEAALLTGRVGAIKIGMLGTAATVQAVAERLAAYGDLPRVLDPVLRASSGGALLDAAGRSVLLEVLLPQVTLLTPNLPEAADLLGVRAARDEAEALEQARELLARGARAVLIKGGHARGPESVDLLVSGHGEVRAFAAARLTASMRGSGCALATAIAAYLARGLELAAACAAAKDYVTARLQQHA
jgi:hydroxymethylpyrimidine/phosphomethylpyrimidine kinase